MKKLSAFVLIAVLFSPFPRFVAAQKRQVRMADKNAAKLRDFEEFVNRQMRRDRIPGMTIGFVKGDYIWVKGFGYADLENEVLAKPETSYQTASILKGMTAAAILQLAERGKINLDAEVQTYVPYFPKKKFPVTIRQLLSHLGGISHYKNNWEKFNKEPKTTRETIAIFANYDLVAEPGTKFSYSTYGYDLLGAVIEEVSGQSYGDFMRENVWKPAGMNDTRVDNPVDFVPNRTRGYQYFDNGEKNALFGEIKNAEFIDFSTRFAAGGARSTVPDMLRFGQAMNEGKLLSKESLNLTRTPPVTRDGRINGFEGTGGYALGGMLLQSNGRFCVYYNGGQQGTSTSIFSFPAENLTIAFAMNIQNSRGFAYFQKLFQLILDEPILTSVYTGNRTSDAQISAMQKVFENGMAYFDVHQKSLSAEEKDLREAFDYFNKFSAKDFLESNRKEALKKIDEGQQPFAGQPFVKLGSFMAQKLSEKYGAKKLKEYHSAGAISFFNDFIGLSENDSRYPQGLRFSEPFRAAVTRWNSDWQKTNTAYVRGLAVTPETDFDAVGRQLKAVFANAEIYPDAGLNIFNVGANGANFFVAVKELLLAGNYQKANRAARLAVELYPQSDISGTALAITETLLDEKDEARKLFRKAAAIDAEGVAGADNLNSIAYDFAAVGKLDDGLKILNAAVELYPQNANLYDSLGELALRKGDKNAAIEFYKKVLELKPDSTNAKKALEKLEQSKK